MLACGVPCGVVWAIILAFLDFTQLGFIRNLYLYLAGLPFFVVGGAGWGAFMWAFERRQKEDKHE
jgi:hypothetical protein